MKVAQFVLPVVAGTMSAMILITLGEMYIRTMYNLPPRSGMQAGEVAVVPANAYAMLLVNYVICSFVAGVVATLLSQRITAIPAVIAGVLLTLAGLYNIIHLSHPSWFTVAALVAYFPFAFAGYLAARRKPLSAS